MILHYCQPVTQIFFLITEAIYLAKTMKKENLLMILMAVCNDIGMSIWITHQSLLSAPTTLWSDNLFKMQFPTSNHSIAFQNA